jgi:hypothetical protein
MLRQQWKKRSVETMVKSFFYRVAWRDVHILRKSLDELAVPYLLETMGEGDLAIVFPDLNGRQYMSVRKIFRGDGLAYPKPGFRERS